MQPREAIMQLLLQKQEVQCMSTTADDDALEGSTSEEQDEMMLSDELLGVDAVVDDAANAGAIMWKYFFDVNGFTDPREWVSAIEASVSNPVTCGCTTSGLFQ